jgi:hypothetical protein
MLTLSLVIIRYGLTRFHEMPVNRPLSPGWELPGTNKFRLMMVLLLLLGCVRGAAAQGLITSPSATDSAPALGGVGGLRPPAPLPFLNGTQNASVKMHLGPTGKPCLTVLGFARPQLINPDIFDHMISASNDCSQLIKVHVCYYESQQCVPIDVPPYGRKETVLGIMPAMNQFQFEYREEFGQGMGGFGTRLN